MDDLRKLVQLHLLAGLGSRGPNPSTPSATPSLDPRPPPLALPPPATDAADGFTDPYPLVAPPPAPQRAPAVVSDPFELVDVPAELNKITRYETDDSSDDSDSAGIPSPPSLRHSPQETPDILQLRQILAPLDQPAPPTDVDEGDDGWIPAIKSVTVSLYTGPEEDDYDDVDLETAVVLPSGSFQRTAGTEELQGASLVGHLFDLVQAGSAEALHRAIMRNKKGTPHVDSMWHNDCTLLQVASSWGHLSVVKLLLVLGADPNLCKTSSATALHFACMNCFKKDDYPEVVRVLMSYGASRALKGSGTLWTGSKSPEEVLQDVNRRFAWTPNASTPERTRIARTLSNLYGFCSTNLASATVVLGSPEWRSRIDRALEHWHLQPPAERGPVVYSGQARGEVTAYMLRTKKVPEHMVVWEAQSLSTVEGALNVHRILAQCPGQIYLVTSAYHALRAKAYFEPLFSGRLTLIVASDEHYQSTRWVNADTAKLWNDYKGMELSFENFTIARRELKIELQRQNDSRMGRRAAEPLTECSADCWVAPAAAPSDSPR